MWIDQPGVGKPVVSIEFGGTPEEYLKNHRFPMLLFSMGDFTLDILVKLGIFSRFFSELMGWYRHWQRLEAAEAQLAEKDQQVGNLDTMMRQKGDLVMPDDGVIFLPCQIIWHLIPLMPK